jgi:hypothetical protein
LLQNSRDTNALHPVFWRSVQPGRGLSPVFRNEPLTFFNDLRIFLTDLKATAADAASGRYRCE